MDIQTCTQCNYPMENSSFPICWTCWKSNQGWARTKADEKYDNLQVLLDKLQKHTAEVEKKSDRRLLKARQFKKELAALRRQSSGIDPDLLRKLIGFCHPDKNTDRDEEATELTRLLLALRPKDP